MHTHTHLFHRFKYLSGELNPILLLAFFFFFFFLFFLCRSLPFSHSLIYSTNGHSSHIARGQNGRYMCSGKRSTSKRKKKSESSIFDNSVIVQLKGDGIILFFFVFQIIISIHICFTISFCPCLLIDLLFISTSVNTSQKDHTHTLFVFHICSKQKKKQFFTNSSLYTL